MENRSETAKPPGMNFPGGFAVFEKEDWKRSAKKANYSSAE
ncbi:hypothetical protein [Allofournierella massiliensis]